MGTLYRNNTDKDCGGGKKEVSHLTFEHNNCFIFKQSTLFSMTIVAR
jgi:hypothetical protein